MTEPRKLRVFLCHASQDKPIVRELYQRLLAEGWIDPWLDEEKLLPGQDWDLEIKKAVEDTHVVIVCLSKSSINKEGYIQKELNFALDFALEKPEGAIFIIPLRLEDCNVPRKLAKWQWVDHFSETQPFRSAERMIQSLIIRANSLGIVTKVDISTKVTLGGHIVYEFGQIDFVKVPAGEFIMGSDDKQASRWEKDQHKVRISYEYYIGRFPITNEQYYMFNNKHKFSSEKREHPVVGKIYEEVEKYTNWLNGVCSGLLPKGYVIQIPSEAEWEKGARGTSGIVWPWGNEFDLKLCNSKESKIQGTTSVGAYSPIGDSPYGASDMAGNVYEWTRTSWGFRKIHSFYPKYKYPYTNSDGREKYSLDDGWGYIKVLRGGSFKRNGWYCRCSSRDFSDEYYAWNDYGFRVAVVPFDKA